MHLLFLSRYVLQKYAVLLTGNSIYTTTLYHDAPSIRIAMLLQKSQGQGSLEHPQFIVRSTGNPTFAALQGICHLPQVLWRPCLHCDPPRLSGQGDPEKSPERLSGPETGEDPQSRERVHTRLSQKSPDRVSGPERFVPDSFWTLPGFRGPKGEGGSPVWGGEEDRNTCMPKSFTKGVGRRGLATNRSQDYTKRIPQICPSC